MKIQITSFKHKLPNKVRLELTKTIINNSSADILLFCGHTIGFVNDIEKLQELVKNKGTEVILELENINTDKIGNCLYHIKNGVIKNLYTNQLFTQSANIEGNYQLADRFIHELETKRCLNIKGVNFLIIQCGEINILKNIQQEENRVEFRFVEDINLHERFAKIMHKTNVVLNPIHTPMGNQGKIQRRREFLSKNSRYYFSTSNTKEDSSNLSLKSLQYAFFNGYELSESKVISEDNCISRIFNISLI